MEQLQLWQLIPLDRRHHSRAILDLLQFSVPLVPTLPATTAPFGWNDPSPLTSIAKSKPEQAAVETISHPIFPMGVVEQPQLLTCCSHDAAIRQANEMNMQHHMPKPTPVQPAAALLLISNEHLIIHDGFLRIKDKCLPLHRVR